MNENHMKTSVTTGEVSLRWAKKADQRAKSSENGPISPNCYLLGLRRRLDYGPRRQKYHENDGNNHLKTVNIRSNGKSRSNLQISPKVDDPGFVTVTADVQNMGDYDGDDVVQLYFTQLITSVNTPVVELGGFKRISLKKGETRTVSIQSDALSTLAFDVNMVRRVEPGTFGITWAENVPTCPRTSRLIARRRRASTIRWTACR